MNNLQSSNFSNGTYILLPRKCRNSLVLSIPKKIDNQTQLYNIFQKTLEEAHNDFKIYVIGVNYTDDELYKLQNSNINNITTNTNNIINDNTDNRENNKKYIYDIVYFMVPKQLIIQLENMGACCLKFYIGYSEDTSEYKILTGAPTLDMVSMHDYGGLYRPYSYITNIS